MVSVLDENDNRPTFHDKVYQVRLPERERRKKAEPIYRVFAYDQDDGPNSDLSYSLVDGNEDGKFFIDPKTAVVSSRKAFAAGSYDILTVWVHFYLLFHSVILTRLLEWVLYFILTYFWQKTNEYSTFRHAALTFRNLTNWYKKVSYL